MTEQSPLIDFRRRKGDIWNLSELKSIHPVGPSDAAWNTNEGGSQEEWIDEFVYLGFREHGLSFLRAIRGRFACAFWDSQRSTVFVARDWIGEQPFHLHYSDGAIYVANRITDIKDNCSDYAYRYVRAVPHAHCQLIHVADTPETSLFRRLEPGHTQCYWDYAASVKDELVDPATPSLETRVCRVRETLLSTVANRYEQTGASEASLLLSGGLDSFSVGVALRKLEIPFKAYTLAVDDRSQDVMLARQFASALNVKHEIVHITKEQVQGCAEEAIGVSECYHVYNVYCAVGMHLLGKALASRGVSHAFCGEAVNEAVGDYTTWQVPDPKSGENRVLQIIDSTHIRRSRQRLLLVWGRPQHLGKQNYQLGSGLAKHAGSRMMKPFMVHGVQLECPYYDPIVLRELICIREEVLAAEGEKPGLYLKMLKEDLKELGIEESLVRSCSKVRFQDASPDGKYGITSVLLDRGFDQLACIDAFNSHFDARLDSANESQRILQVSCSQ